MIRTTVPLLLATCALAAASSAAVAQRSDTIAPYLWQPGMARSEVGQVNVFRRFPAEYSDAMTEFYGDVLGIEALPPSAPGGGQMIRYPIGDSEVKLFPVAGRELNLAAVSEAVGARLITLFFAEEAPLRLRFEQYGYMLPLFAARPDGSRRALVQDPAGEWIELVLLPTAGPAALERFEIGITASDLEQSRAFYGGVLGLEEHGPIRDAVLGVDKVVYQHGTTTINVWSFGAGLPVDTQAAGLQYIVWDVERVNSVAEARGVPIDRPLSPPGQMRTVWLLDPDGVSNYFAQYSGNDNTPPD